MKDRDVIPFLNYLVNFPGEVERCPLVTNDYQPACIPYRYHIDGILYRGSQRTTRDHTGGTIYTMPPSRLPSGSSGYHTLDDPTVGHTTNHLYNPRECIGQGASSYVFLGLHKSTGEKRALKILKMARYQKEASREITALLLLKHRNVVKFYDVEEDISSGMNVLVMEYCNGGSLYAMLQEPEYKHGLPDQEFLFLIRDICSGLRVLQSQNIVHRDIKPGNILRHIDRGRSEYKLSDFGSSLMSDKHNEDDIGFMSMAGTEEYLHPMLYECAFVTRNGQVRTTANVELWSVGVSLYQAATGTLPFKPHGGSRNNRNAMYQMISKKPRNKISGVQETSNGRFLWSDNLPRDCNLSEGLRHEMKYILVGLLETNPARTWTYDTLFHAVDRIQECTVIHVLYTVKCDTYTIYLDKHSSFSYLRERLAETTDQPSCRHVYFYNNRRLICEDNRVSSLPCTSRESPIILALKDNQDAFDDINISLDDLISFHGDVAFHKDCKTALRILSNIYMITNSMDSMKTSLRVLQNFEKNHSDHLNGEIHQCDLNVKKEEKLLEQDVFFLNHMKEHKGTNTRQSDGIHEMEELLLKIRVRIGSAAEHVESVRNSSHKPPQQNSNRVSESQCICEGIVDQCKNIWHCIKFRTKLSRPSTLDCLNHSNDKCQLESLYFTIHQHWALLREQVSQYSDTYTQFVRWSLDITENIDSINIMVRETEELRRQFHENLVTLSVYSLTEKMNDDLTIDYASPTETKNICRERNGIKPICDEINMSREYINLLKEETVLMENMIHGLCIE